MSDARPFIKWVGGKTQLLAQLLPLFPTQANTYFEPFMGGAAVFYALAQKLYFKQAHLNDWNTELVDTYRTVQTDPEGLITQLQALPYSRTDFELLRAKDPAQLSLVERAARMIFLNKTGFNGLYRVNKAGKFNVPFGQYKTPPKTCDAENLRACSKVLKNTTITSGDFADSVKEARAGDVVYFDPPYVPLSATSNFKSYTSEGFTVADQERLAALCGTLQAKGVFVLASNSSAPLVRDLYANFQQVEVQARRSINSKGDKRGAIGELVLIGNPYSS